MATEPSYKIINWTCGCHDNYLGFVDSNEQLKTVINLRTHKTMTETEKDSSYTVDGPPNILYPYNDIINIKQLLKVILRYRLTE